MRPLHDKYTKDVADALRCALEPFAQLGLSTNATVYRGSESRLVYQAAVSGLVVVSGRLRAGDSAAAVAAHILSEHREMIAALYLLQTGVTTLQMSVQPVARPCSYPTPLWV
jgi:hypothetical protein